MTATAYPVPQVHACPHCHIYIFGGFASLASHVTLFHSQEKP